MAIRAFDPMDVVRALRFGIGRVHLLHVDAAVGHLRVAGLARGAAFSLWPSWQEMQLMPSCTPMGVRSSPEPPAVPSVFGRRRARLRLPRRMALVAERLARVLAHRHRAGAIIQLRNGERSGGKVDAFAAVIEGQRIVERPRPRRRCARRAWFPARLRGGPGGRSCRASPADRQSRNESCAMAPWCSCGCTRSRIEPLKCMPWQRKQSSISMRLVFCAGSAKIWV